MEHPIAILGFYDHQNFGDEQYKNSIPLLFSPTNTQFSFLDIDKLVNNNTNLKKFKTILVGGGDILNDYFLDKLEKIFLDSNEKKRIKVCGISIGCPYVTKRVITKISKIFHTLFFRSNIDLNDLQPHIPSVKCFFLPDVSIYSLINNPEFFDTSVTNVKKKSIGICLPRSIYNPEYRNEYREVIKSLAKVFNKLIDLDYKLFFIPFNTDPHNKNENDIRLAKDILSFFDDNNINKVTILKETDLKIFSQMDYIFAGRYHAILYSIYYKIPLFPMFTTRKIKNFLLENNWNIGYEFDTNWKDIPIKVNDDVLLSRLFSFLDEKNKPFYQRKLEKILSHLTSSFIKNKELIKEHASHFEEFCEYCELWKLLQKNKNEESSFLAGLCMYKLLGMPNSKYNWGLQQKLENINKDDFIFDYHSEFRFIENDAKSWKEKIKSNSDGLFKLTFIDQMDYHQVHRSGWDFVIRNLIPFNNDNLPLLLDSYIDRTFHWDCKYLEKLNIIPYSQPWIGFIHHTFDTTFSNYNSSELFKKEVFLESLKTCKGLFVFSNDIAKKIRRLNLPSGLLPPIINLVHPSDHNVPVFDFYKFKKNKTKKILSVGGWMRNIYSFYKLDLHTFINCDCCFDKVAIRGKFMNNYFPSDDFLSQLTQLTINDKTMPTIKQGTVLSNPPIEYTSGFINQFLLQISYEINSVKILDTLSNDQYDNILTKNIVYINLIDAAAVNTILECAIRMTPIIVNKLPAVMEILGEDYPLYIENIDKITCKDIKRAHLYLKSIHKNILYKTNIKTFVENFVCKVKELT